MASHTRARALAACRQLLPPLVRVLIRFGVSAPEFSNVCRQVYVNTAAARLANSAKRVNKSRIAIVTGLTRAEVTKLLRHRASATATQQWQLHRASRVLIGWFTDAEFSSRRGRPRELPLKGRRGSFQALVKRYSGDIPPRAMLDELSEMSAICRQRNGTIRVVTRSIGSPRLSSKDIVALGTKGQALLDTLCRNVEDPSNRLFAATVTGTGVDPRIVDLLLERIRLHGRDFLNRIDDQFRHPPGGYKARGRGRSEKLGVTVIAHREPAPERRTKRGSGR